MVLVWVLAFALAIAYYNVPVVQAGFQTLLGWKIRIGLAFAAMIGFIAGGILPEVAKWLTRTLVKDENVFQESIFRGLVWGGLAIMVDTFYGFQALWFGTSIEPLNLAKKTAVDMFIFAPTIFVPYMVGMFAWRREHYRFSALISVFTPKGWKTEVFPTYVPNVCFWIVALFAIYSMPTGLQYPLSALATACWSILFVFLQKRDAPAAVS